MGIYPEKPSERNIDQLANDIRVVTDFETRVDGYPNAPVTGDIPNGMTIERELPPKYEDLDQPPRYDEQMFVGTPAIDGLPTSNTTSDNELSQIYAEIPFTATRASNVRENPPPERH